MMSPELEELLKNTTAKMALVELWTAFSKHNDFWTGWIGIRTGPLADALDFTSNELTAAVDLKAALLKVYEGFESLENALKEER